MNTLQLIMHTEGSEREEGYGKCPVCGGKGVTRERSSLGNTECENGHVYPSKISIYTKPSKNQKIDLIPVGAKVKILDWTLARFEGTRPEEDWEFRVSHIKIFLDMEKTLVSYHIYAYDRNMPIPQVQEDKLITFYRIPLDNLQHTLARA